MLNLPDVPVVAVDTEGSGFYPDDGARVSLVQICWGDEPNQRRALGFGQGDPDSLFGYCNLGGAAWGELIYWLSQRQLVFHNAAHDLRVLAAGTVAGSVGEDLVDQLHWDTMLAAWILEPNELLSLDEVAARLLSTGKAKSDLEAWRNGKEGRRAGKLYSRAPMEVIVPYGLTDVWLTWRIYQAQLKQLEIDSWAWPHIRHELEVCKTYHRMTTRGIGFDREGAKGAIDAARVALAQAQQAVPFQPVTETQARTWFYTTKGALPHCVTPKGQKSVAECCVRQLIKAKVPGAAEYARAVKLETAISMWYTGYSDKVGKDGRLRTDIRQTGTVSMRSSSQRVNLQALPHDYRLEPIDGVPSPRSLFIAAPGRTLYELDLSQAELRYAAKAAGCETILKLLRKGADVHGTTARQLFGVTEDDPSWKQMRNVAKRANFSAIFGIGARKFNADVEKQTGLLLGEKRASEILTAWRSLYPEFGQANAKAERLVMRRKYIKLVGGRQRWYKPHESPHSAFNQHVQGSLAQAKKLWMVAVDRECPGTLVLEVHDSLVMECWTEYEAVTAAKIGEEICTEFLGVPMLVDVKVWE